MKSKINFMRKYVIKRDVINSILKHVLEDLL